MTRKTLIAAMLLPVLALGALAQNGNEATKKSIEYTNLLATAEQQLDAKKLDEALGTLKKALALNVPDSSVRQLRLNTSNSTAHYLMAVAYTLKKDVDKGVESLTKAAQNGFTDTARVKSDERLAALRKDARFASDVLPKLPKEKLTDRFAGKTVANNQFGMQLIYKRKGNFPKLGESAPDFELDRIDKKGTIKLSSFEGKTPVALVFGSYT